VPVAEEYKVKRAFHPQDPAMPADTWRPRRAHGARIGRGPHAIHHDQAEPVSRPELLPGHRGRDAEEANIRGGFLNVQETFIDEGDVDMLKAMRVYKEVGFDGMMMPDHVPKIDGDARSAQAFAYAPGYIKALIAAVSAEA
jgi:mannonate dehydratase